MKPDAVSKSAAERAGWAHQGIRLPAANGEATISGSVSCEFVGQADKRAAGRASC